MISSSTAAHPVCPYCNSFHPGKCALVKAFEYHPDGTVKRVEFYAPSDYVPAIFAHPAPNDRLPKTIT